MGTRARVTTVAGAATLLCAASIFGAGSSLASSTPAKAAAPQSLVAGCGDTVQGQPGQPVGVRVAGLSVMNLGQVPQSGSTTFDASSAVQGLLGGTASPLCQVTAEALPLPKILAPVESAAAPVLNAVQSATGLAPQQPAPAAPAPQQAPVSQQVAAQPQAAPAPMFGPPLPHFAPFAFGRYHSNLPLYDYSALLVGRPGSIGSLQTGMLSPNLFGTATGPGNVAAQDPAASDVAAAGRASALPASGAERVALPILVAVLMLAIVSAALIRSWLVVTRR